MDIADTYKAAALAKRYSQAKAVYASAAEASACDPFNGGDPTPMLEFIDRTAAAKALMPLLLEAIGRTEVELRNMGVSL